MLEASANAGNSEGKDIAVGLDDRNMTPKANWPAMQVQSSFLAFARQRPMFIGTNHEAVFVRLC